MKPTPTLRPLGGRTLRLGARGERVRRLQLHLHNLGYDPGPADGLYGHLTFAAVRELQRDFRLHADGTAGRRVLAALSDEQLTNVQRRVVIAEIHSSTSAGLAARVLQRNAASLSGIALPARVTTDETPEQSDQPDQPARSAQSAPSAQSGQPERSARWQPTASGRIKSRSVKSSAGKRGANGPVRLSSSDPLTVAKKHGLSVWHTLHTRVEEGGGPYEEGRSQHVLHNAAARGQLERQAARLLTTDACGNLYLDLGQVAWGDGGRLLTVVRKLSRHANRQGRELVVSVPLRIGGRGWDRLFRELDRSALAALATRIVLVPPVSVPIPRHGPSTNLQRPPSPQQLSAAIREIVQDVPPWRCLLMVPVGAVVLSEDHAPIVFAYQQALALAYNSRTRPRWDETVRRPTYVCTYAGRSVSVWLENRYSIAHKLDVVDHRRLAGVYLSAVGLEDARVWGLLRDRWQVHRSPKD